LLERLRAYGFNAGPIIGSTREVYQRKLARLLRDEDYEDLGEADDDNVKSPLKMNTSYDSSYIASPSITVEELRRRPLSRVADESWASPSPRTPSSPWSPDDIVSQVQPPPGEEEVPLISARVIAVVIIAFLVFALIVFYNMESTPATPFS